MLDRRRPTARALRSVTSDTCLLAQETRARHHRRQTAAQFVEAAWAAPGRTSTAHRDQASKFGSARPSPAGSIAPNISSGARSVRAEKNQGVAKRRDLRDRPRAPEGPVKGGGQRCKAASRDHRNGREPFENNHDSPDHPRATRQQAWPPMRRARRSIGTRLAGSPARGQDAPEHRQASFALTSEAAAPRLASPSHRVRAQSNSARAAGKRTSPISTDSQRRGR